MAGGPKASIKKALRGVGLELQRFDPEGSFAKRRQRQLESEQIDLVIDVGAHAGEYAGSLRHEGYANRILSFEPQAEMFGRLQEASQIRSALGLPAQRSRGLGWQHDSARLRQRRLQQLDHSFLLADLEPGFQDPRTTQLLQVDGLFIRS